MRFCVRACTRSHACIGARTTYILARGRRDTEGGGSCPDREMRIVSVYELSGVGEQIAQSN